jgi:hypothetical protein
MAINDIPFPENVIHSELTGSWRPMVQADWGKMAEGVFNIVFEHLGIEDIDVDQEKMNDAMAATGIWIQKVYEQGRTDKGEDAVSALAKIIRRAG